ncbi:MAG: hydrogenase maturation factor [Lachnospiraceae bacterium]|nr:hydrogenase maturation factor [Lachnospiraceae bacterium]
MNIGKVSESVLKRSVLKQLKTRREEIISGAGVGDDCAIFSVKEGEKVVSCVQEGVVGPAQTVICEQDIQRDFVMTMQQLVQKCANNLVAGGAEPIAIMLALLLPETAEEADLRQIMKEAEDACHALSMQIMGGQTRVLGAVKEPVAVITGYGKVTDDYYRTAKSAKPGQDIVISKWIGLEGTAALARHHEQGLLSRYPAYLVEEAAGFDRYLSVLPEAAVALQAGVCAMHDASEGGIFAALWELAEGAGLGLTIDLKKLPLRQETVEVCEYCNVNPYELQSGGSLVMTAEDGATLVAALEAEGIPAVVVGKLTSGKDRLILNEDEVRYVDRPRTKQRGT